MYASKTIKEIASAKSNSTLKGPPVLFQQIHMNGNLSVTRDIIRRAEESGAKALVWTTDAPAASAHHRAARYYDTNPDALTSALTWDVYEQMKSRTSLPIIPKGIATVEDALAAAGKGVPAIYIGNHGARQVDHSPSPLEIAYEIRRNAPEVSRGGRGARRQRRAVRRRHPQAAGARRQDRGPGRHFMFTNAHGAEGVRKAIRILKAEIAADAAQLGIHDVQNIPASFTGGDGGG
ncbi:hypothetical protein DL765_005808 [Monosporascus sp. GIB2]|nr:hypothetical protein DL765_005808 [Monosporascus sp. GIB2]